MNACDEIRERLDALAALAPAEVAAGDREHLAVCATCARVLAAARLARGLVAAVGEEPEPPAGFAARVLASLPAGAARGRAQADLWRPAWGLVPVFAVTAAALLVLFQASPAPMPAGLVPAEGLSAGERLVLEGRSSDADLVLATVMEGGGR